jgi:hypothetical protein
MMLPIPVVVDCDDPMTGIAHPALPSMTKPIVIEYNPGCGYRAIADGRQGRVRIPHLFVKHVTQTRAPVDIFEPSD